MMPQGIHRTTLARYPAQPKPKRWTYESYWFWNLDIAIRADYSASPLS